MRSLVLVCVLAACSKTTSEPATGSAAIADARVAVVDRAPPPSVPLGPTGVPKLCDDWKASIDKLATCKALPANVRESLTAVYTQASASWGQLSAAAKANLAAICKAGAVSVDEGAKATCGW